MGIVGATGLAVLILLFGLIVMYARRQIISRHGGTINMNMRLSTYVPHRGWAPGVCRFTNDELRWYRVFSFGVRPRRVLSRDGLVVEERRRPEGAERLAMPEGWVVIRCRPKGGTGPPVELAIAETSLTALLSWLESAPPSAIRYR